jgi:hypothetical protein
MSNIGSSDFVKAYEAPEKVVPKSLIKIFFGIKIKEINVSIFLSHFQNNHAGFKW